MTFCKTTWIFRMIISKKKEKKKKHKKETNIAVSKRNTVTY